jgi:hypothetical protein
VSVTVRAIRESLQLIQSNQELTRETIAREVKKINALVSRLEAELGCPLEKDCARILNGGKNRA